MQKKGVYQGILEINDNLYTYLYTAREKRLDFFLLLHRMYIRLHSRIFF